MLRTMSLIIQYGAFPEISHAELCARVPEATAGRLVAGRFWITDAPLSPEWLIKNLGGVIKVAQIEDSDPSPEALATIVAKHASEHGKLTFGVSRVGFSDKKIGFETKRVLRTMLADRSVRLVTARDAEFSSATTILEHLLPPHGVELLLIHDKKEILVARTVAAQPFDEWSRRDFDRPGRNAHRGMLPPKLARMMINLALGAHDAAGTTIYDPFCGSGAVVSEALLLGATRVFGSDIAPAAVADTKKMVAWLKKTATIFQHDATKPYSSIKKGSVDAIVAEPFLGRPLKQGEKLNKNEKNDLETLYNRALLSLAPLLRPNGRVVLALPYFPQENSDLSLENILAHTPFSVDPLLPDQPTLRYHRPDQRIGRQIIRLFF